LLLLCITMNLFVLQDALIFVENERFFRVLCIFFSETVKTESNGRADFLGGGEWHE
jgi:hypothetical protein